MNFLRNLLSRTPPPPPAPIRPSAAGDRPRSPRLAAPLFDKVLKGDWLIITGPPVREIVIADFRDCPNLMPKTFAAALLIPLADKIDTFQVGGTVQCYACQQAFDFEFTAGGEAPPCRDVGCPNCHAVVEMEHRALTQFSGNLSEFEGREGQLLTVRPGLENKKLATAFPVALTVHRCRLEGAFPKDLLGNDRA